jgi:hypothetical protein
MSQFKYTLPSGAKFTITAPAGTTQTQADKIFYTQVAAGSLVGFTAGQSISSTQSTAVKFALSRVDRGTAGVPDTVILAIVNGLPTITGIPSLVNTPLQNPITAANIANIKSTSFTPAPIGPLSSSQVQGIMAQVANFVDQPADVMTNDKGVGQYGLDCQQLEQAGYVKPGTYQQFIFDPSPLTDVMSAPGIFTGLNGINTAREFLNNPAAQNGAMSSLMTNAYNSLTATGTITLPTASSVSALVGKVYTQSGLQSLSAVSAATGISFSIPNLSSLTAGLPNLSSLTSALPNVSGITTALANSPVGGLLSSATTNLSTLASGAVNIPGVGSLQNISGAVDKLTAGVTADVGALITNASKFGTAAAASWASSLPSISSLTSNLPSISSLTSALPTLPGMPSVASLTTDLNVLGKAAQFATGATNPLTSLSNLGSVNLPSLSSLTAGLPSLSSLSSGLPSLSSLSSGIPSLSSLASSLPSLSSLTSKLPNLSALTAGLPSLGSLGNLGSLSKLTDLFGAGSGSLLGGSTDPLVAATSPGPGFNNTVNRATLDAATNRILGNPKIPTPSFDYPDPNSPSAKAALDINYAKTKLQELQGQGTALLTQVQGAVDSAGSGIPVFKASQVNQILG